MIPFILFSCSLFAATTADIYDYYECNNALIHEANLKATSYNRDQGPKDAVLYGSSAWSPVENNYYQFITFELGDRYKVHAIATQGRSRRDEFVTEYIVQYSDDGYGWRSYNDYTGEAEMFKGNSDGDSVQRNEFEVPIIAQWIRINPTRWHEKIAMRVELFGCHYESDVLSFNGSSLLIQDLLRDPIAAYRETIRLRFKTNSANGVIMYSRGTQGDYISLQLKFNRMILNIDLGSGTVTSLSVGSLLDDNIWHDVVISRNRRDILFSVDRVVVQSRIKGEFSRLNLNRALYFGGVPNIQEGLSVTQNFTGCLENIYLNSTNLIREVNWAIQSGYMYRYNKINTADYCAYAPLLAVTFLTQNVHAKLQGYEGSRSLNASFEFRTFEENAMMLFHSFSSDGHVAIFLELGKIKVELVSNNAPKIVLDNYQENFNDGRWHTVVLTISTDSLILSVDYRPMKTIRHLRIVTGHYYYIAGGVSSQIGINYIIIPGFVGCMRSISIDGNNKLPSDWTNEEYCCDKDELAFDTCRMTDRCNPNPCEHGGTCKQNSMEFLCDCVGTGYGGAVCHTTLNALSCEGYKNVHSVNQRAEIDIDVDGSGPLSPFPVVCEFFADGRVETVIQHSNPHTTPVDGFQEPGSYKQNIIYTASDDQIRSLVNRSMTCKQRISYQCRASRMFNSPTDGGNFHPFTWWVSGNNQNMDYWGGSIPGSRKCECGILGLCIDRTKGCNCDAGYETWQEDAGDIIEKDNLPVKQVRIGDTGNALDEKEGRFTLGPLRCEGDDLFNNVITFRLSDATINLPPFDMGHSGDIYLEFKTTIDNAVILHAKGRTDFIKLSIVGGELLQFEYQAGLAPITLTYRTSYRLTDDKWHTVAVERNRKGARLVVDGALKTEVREPPGPIRALHLMSSLVIGATVDYRDGFTGCIRSLLLNGNLVDLRSYARRNTYGISEGCVGKCQSDPCLNRGICHEKYDGYWCDCRFTGFKGPICADEIGVNMKQSSLIKYDFEGDWKSTISENIRVGWTTTNPKGFLLGLFSNISGEYMTIMVSNSGSLKVVFDFGFERREVIYPKKHFGLGQYHNLWLTRKNSGSTMVLTVDGYDPEEFHFDVKQSADAQFNNIQTLYIGRNETMTEGFSGCISRVEFDEIYPLKLLFQQKPPSNVKILGSPLTEDFCGVEPFTHPPDVVETRPPLDINEDKLKEAYHETDSALLGGILAVVVICIFILAFLIGRYLHRHKGEYLTQEDLGAESAFDPDTAVVQGTTGHQVQKKKEWFI